MHLNEDIPGQHFEPKFKEKKKVKFDNQDNNDNFIEEILDHLDNTKKDGDD